MKGKIFRINEFGLCEVALSEAPGWTAFTLDKLVGYGGQSLREFGVKEGAEVEVEAGERGGIASVQLLSHAASGT